MDVLFIVIGVTDKPCTWRDVSIATTRRGLMTGWSVWIPDAAFTGRRIVSLRDVQPSVAVAMKIRVAVIIALDGDSPRVLVILARFASSLVRPCWG